MIDKFLIDFPAVNGMEKRAAYVYVPDKKGRFPVLYMFDGHNVFFDEDATYGKCWGMLGFLQKHKIPLIVAAVECNHGANNERLREYSPFTFTNEKLGKIEGCGKTTMEWYIKTFKPLVDKNYPTLRGRDNTFIAGSSMGGLMSLYAVTQYNRIFSKAACLSPSIWFASKKLDDMIRQSTIREGTVIYMDYGSNEMRHHKNMASRFCKVTSLLLQKGVYLNSRIVPRGDHCEASWEKQLPFFIKTLLYKG